MSQDLNRCDFIVEFVLMGILDHNKLSKLYQLTKDAHNAKEWQVDWYEDIPKLISSGKSQFESPSSLYDKTFELTDLGKLTLRTPSSYLGIEDVSIYLQEGLEMSFLIRTQNTFNHNLSNGFASFVKRVKDSNTELERIAENIGLTPTSYTWTVRIQKCTIDTDQLISDGLGSGTNSIVSALQTTFNNVDSASRIGKTLLVKLVEGGKEQYFILCLGEENEDIAIDKLYYLAIAKWQIKQLIQSFRLTYSDSMRRLEEQLNDHILSPKVKPSRLNELLLLRRNIILSSNQSKKMRDQIQLVKNFLQFHCGDFLNEKEDRLIDSLRGIIESERMGLELFYIGPLENLAIKSEEEVQSILDSVEGITDIFTTEVNLQLQGSIRKLTLITTLIAILSLVITIIGLIR